MDFADLGVLERIATIIQTQQRQAAAQAGLQMVHYGILDYLSRANRFSNTPLAVAQWLGLTKGTVSQSITLLEKKGYLEKRADAKDKRRQHLILSEKGRDVIANANQAQRALFESVEVNSTYSRIFRALLNDIQWQLQEKTGGAQFGPCGTCRHSRTAPDGSPACALIKETLSRPETEQVCRAHKYAA